MPSDQPLIEARGLSKRYRRNRGRIIESMGMHHLLGELAGMPWRAVRRILSPTEPARSSDDDGTFWALENASFDLHAGETLGVIGENGAGKSVLLKILARITPPTEGTATIRGRVGAMLEVSAGFHHELTGRENVFLSGAILGMSQREIAARLNRIIDFAEISDAIDTPVKRYSSGMTARLAFSVAAHLDAEIMLVDEVLAVGDTAFKAKCL
ncbi:MAG: ABC transporter ATP-binding protein, partial [Phycisphaeraceae bacterium]|nr:ABC transporter ATP-binding protein [Phycisphaeraceae bacterium]